MSDLCVDFFGVVLGHGEQKDFNGHDAKGGFRSALQTVHFPHAAEHEVTTDKTHVSVKQMLHFKKQGPQMESGLDINSMLLFFFLTALFRYAATSVSFASKIQTEDKTTHQNE